MEMGMRIMGAINWRDDAHATDEVVSTEIEE